MKLCEVCPRAGECDRSKCNGWGECLNQGAQMDIWEPMSEEVPKKVPILTAAVRKDRMGYPLLNVVTVCGNDNAVHWTGVVPFKWKPEEYIAWCDFTKLTITFDEA